jgi:hypothetical protein
MALFTDMFETETEREFEAACAQSRKPNRRKTAGEKRMQEQPGTLATAPAYYSWDVRRSQ